MVKINCEWDDEKQSLETVEFHGKIRRGEREKRGCGLMFVERPQHKII